MLNVILQQGWSAIMYAADKGHTNIVEYLLSVGAKIDLRNNVSIINMNNNLPLLNFCLYRKEIQL